MGVAVGGRGSCRLKKHTVDRKSFDPEAMGFMSEKSFDPEREENLRFLFPPLNPCRFTTPPMDISLNLRSRAYARELSINSEKSFDPERLNFEKSFDPESVRISLAANTRAVSTVIHRCHNPDT